MKWDLREVADRILFMDDGQIIEDTTPAQFFANPEQRKSSFIFKSGAKSLEEEFYA